MGGKSFKFRIRFVDSSTGEIIFVSKKIHTLFCGGDGERFLSDILSSYERGLRSKDNLCVEIVADRIECVQPDFPNLF